MLPTVNFFGTEVTRLILGDNPVHGHTYIHDIFTSEEMTSFYTGEKIIEMLTAAETAGYNTILALASPVMLNALREFRARGGKLHIIFQTYPPCIDRFAENVDEMMEFNPLAIYHQGSTGETLLENGDVETYLANVETIRKTGLPAGMAFHDPENVLRAESEKWGADFYTLCPYNSRCNRKGHQSSFITGESKSDLVFHPDDRFTMFEIIREIHKPVVVIKALAGGQILIGKTEAEYPAVIEKYLAEAFGNIKNTDLICVGVFQRDGNQIAQNAEIARGILEFGEKNVSP
jgi:hypothetical protein